MPDQSGPVILIVSREDDVRFLFKTLLGIWGYQVEENESIENLSSNGEKAPDVILVDAGIPFADEMKHLSLLREAAPFGKVPVILFSGWTTPKSRPTALENGANEFLIKPVDFDLLEILLQRFTNHKNY